MNESQKEPDLHIDDSPELLSLINRGLGIESLNREVWWKNHIGKKVDVTIVEERGKEIANLVRQLVKKPFKPLAIYYNAYFSVIYDRFTDVFSKNHIFNAEQFICKDVTYKERPVTKNNWSLWLQNSSVSNEDRKRVFDKFISKTPSYEHIVKGYFSIYWTILEEIGLTLDELYKITDGVSVKELTAFLEKLLVSLQPELKKIYAEMVKQHFGRDPEYYDDPWSIYYTTIRKLNEKITGLTGFDSVISYLNKMGYNLDRITIDAIEREKKRSSAFCTAIRVPDDIRISLHGTKGYKNIKSAIHEFGHAVYYSGINPELPNYLRFTGDREVLREIPSMLFDEYLLSIKGFRDKILGLDSEVVDKVLTEINKAKMIITGMMAIISLAKLKNYESHSLDDITRDCDYLTKCYLEAPLPPDYWYIAPQAMFVQSLEVYIYSMGSAIELGRKLESEFGNNWWNKREAHEILRSYWYKGLSTADHLPEPNPEKIGKWLIESIQ